MKILHIVHSYPPYSFGGTELYTQDLCEALSKHNRINILASRFKEYGSETTPTENILENIGITFFNRHRPETYEQTYFDRRNDERFLALIKHFSPDVVHVQHLLFHSMSFINILTEASIPFVMTLHDYWYLCPQCFLTKTDGSLCNGPGNGDICLSCDNADGNGYIPPSRAVLKNGSILFFLKFAGYFFPTSIREWAGSWVIRQKRNAIRSTRGFLETKERLRWMVSYLNRAGRIISPSEVISERYNAAGVNDIIVIPHGVRSSNITPGHDKYEQIANRHLAFGYIGSIMPHKGLHVLIEAFKLANDTRAQLLIYGKAGDHPEYDLFLRKLATLPSIRFMGPITHESIFDAIKTIDAVVIPSICTENFPLVANEAFFAKTPVIASNVGGLSKLIVPGKNGFLFEKGNSGALAEILSHLIANPHTLSVMSRSIPPVKTMTEHACEIENIYDRAIAANRRKQKYEST
ncbi:MAG: glycosyltransferase [Chitinispirillaceae bacterium]|nr:glycosyltransferase [Chitinispirillaceae bacterium]